MRAERADKTRPFRVTSGRRPLVLGHRGARHAAPENTALAFELALSEGADGVELDVRLDGDGRVIVLHDADLRRVSNGVETRAAERLSPEELGRVDVGRGERVPLLADVLAWARERGTRVNVELKQDVKRPHSLLLGVRHVVRATRAPPELVVFSSFHPLFVRALCALVPDFACVWLVHQKQRWLKRAPLWELVGHGVNPQHTLVTAAAVARWRRHAGIVGTWTVNDPAEALRVARLGVDLVISDRPGAILSALSTEPAHSA